MSGEEEDWGILMSEELGSGGTEEPGRPGESRVGNTSGLEMLVRSVGVVEGLMMILKQLYLADWQNHSQSMRAPATRYP